MPKANLKELLNAVKLVKPHFFSYLIYFRLSLPSLLDSEKGFILQIYGNIFKWANFYLKISHDT